ncbi:MAG: ABC transporter ATPase [Bacteroidia bacterium]|nr:ABC transporter ATPase [Bacteroidia bacterium]NNC84831.1 ABC transporter ATPase [Bacteroidia bacterium]NNM16496.1 ABC transporter ATPase [Bacteroidia bacterium]
MYTEFNQLSKNSKVWVYLSNRKFTSHEVIEIEGYLQSFVTQWTAHNQDLKASYQIYRDCAIVLSVDESLNDASGCSIDSSVRAIREIEAKYKVELFDRNLVTYEAEGQMMVVSMDEFKNLLVQGKVNDDTIVLNPLVKTKEELETAFELPLQKSWHQQLI